MGNRSLMKIIITLLQIILWQGLSFSADTDTLYINEDFTECKLGKYARYMSDSSNGMSLNEFINITQTAGALLKNNQRDEISIGYTQQQHWLVFHLKNVSDKPLRLYLSLSYPNLDHVLVYQTPGNETDSVKMIAEMGDNFKKGNKQMLHRNYVVPVNIPPGSNTDFILQIKNQWEPLNFPVFLSNEYYLVRRTNNDNLFLGLYFGIHFTFALLIFTLFLFTRNHFFLLYLVLTSLSAINMISDTGLGFQFFWYDMPFLQKILPYIISFGTIILHITFIRMFFSTALHFERFNQFLLGMLGLVLFTLIGLLGFALGYPESNLPYQISYGVINTLYMSYGFVILTLSAVAFYQVRRKEILWVLLAVSIHFAYWFLNILVRGNAFPVFLKDVSIYQFNLFPGHLSTPHIVIVIILVEIVIVSFILSSNFYSFIKDNSASKYKLMLLQRQTINAYIEGQEKERSRLAQNISSQLKEDINLLRDQMNDYLKNLDDPITRSKVSQLIHEVEKVSEDISRITTNFVPSEYVNKSFYDAVRSICQPLKISGKDVKIQLQEPSPAISDFNKVNVCRILQEITGNINKHSGADQVSILMNYNIKELTIQVKDNGSGFDIKDAQSGGIGLMNISSRVNGLNGQVNIESQHGEGTKITIIIPLNELK